MKAGDVSEGLEERQKTKNKVDESEDPSLRTTPGARRDRRTRHMIIFNQPYVDPNIWTEGVGYVQTEEEENVPYLKCEELVTDCTSDQSGVFREDRLQLTASVCSCRPKGTRSRKKLLSRDRRLIPAVSYHYGCDEERNSRCRGDALSAPHHRRHTNETLITFIQIQPLCSNQSSSGSNGKRF